MQKSVASLLEDATGLATTEWVIPYPFLPPRYQKLAQRRNMLLVIDTDLTAHIRWEGKRRSVWCSLTDKQIVRLVREIKARINQYQKDLSVLAAFAKDWVERPYMDPVYAETKSTADAPAYRKDPVPVVAEIQTTKEGGEFPLPKVEFF